MPPGEFIVLFDEGLSPERAKEALDRLAKLGFKQTTMRVGSMILGEISFPVDWNQYQRVIEVDGVSSFGPNRKVYAC